LITLDLDQNGIWFISGIWLISVDSLGQGLDQLLGGFKHALT
jgi:hypothetical protein